ncbi:hypothetical protein BZG36_01186 [Bifiguratus adelaidae]|uniref:ATPase inhibitor, mitochondrial n=1 Tax=Bifiguratus adelaidae TaxID=1938954 RepID=A0A261Y5P5_9FUNG|nr:hypothetical protein BZG36_01186 [Bifiguratus adelaidae]
MSLIFKVSTPLARTARPSVAALSQVRAFASKKEEDPKGVAASEGIAGSAGFNAREKSIEGQYARQHDREQLAAFRKKLQEQQKELDAAKANLEKLEKESKK